MKHPPLEDTCIDPARLLAAFDHALLAGSPEHELADYDAAIWAVELEKTFGVAAGKVIAGQFIAIAGLEQLVCSLEGRVADLEVAGERRRPYGTRSVGDMVQWVATELGLRVGDIRGDSRHQTLFTARAAIVWATRKLIPDCSLARIGRALGGRDHSTIINAERRAGLRRNVDPEFRDLTDRLVAAFTISPEGAR